MIIDSHVHISLYKNNAKDLKGALALLLSEMKKNKINYAIVIPDNLENLSSIADLNMAKKLIGKNKKFFLLGSPQIIQRGASEVEKYKKLITDGVIRGIKLFPGHDPYFPTDKRCEPYYELCQKSGAPIVIHTGANSEDNSCAKWNDPKYIVKVAKEYPRLQIIIAHYFWPRIDYCFKVTQGFNNIHFDLSAMADEEVVEKSGGLKKIRAILQKTINQGDDKILFGTDWPMCDVKKHIDLIKSLKLSKAIEEKIFHKNAIKLFKLPIALK